MQQDEFKNSEIREEVVTTLFKCPNCGNNFEFSPKQQKLVCRYCDTTEEIDNVLRVEENTFMESNSEKDLESEDVEVYRCENCGSISEKPKGEIAFSCPYCKKTNVVLDKDIKGIKPTGLIPFKINKQTTIDIAKSWLKKKIFAPRKAKKARFDGIVSGMYSPCWTFDSNTYSVYEGRVGDRRTRTVGSGKNRRTETYIVWRHISGSVEDFYDDVLVPCGKNIKEKEFGKVANYNTNNAVQYDSSFLAGFTAVHYQIGLQDAYDIAKEKIDDEIYEKIKDHSHCDVVDYINVKTAYSNQKYKYILLPFWLGAFPFGDKKYGFLVNGVTGDIYGKYPKSPLRIAIAVLLGLGVAALLYLILSGTI